MTFESDTPSAEIDTNTPTGFPLVAISVAIWVPTVTKDTDRVATVGRTITIGATEFICNVVVPKRTEDIVQIWLHVL